MTLINGILLSGWFQITILSILFFIYSNRALSRRYLRGYALGWLLGLFFIFSYASLNPISTLQLGAFDYRLNLLQVLVVSAFGFFLSIAMSLMTYTFRDNPKWRSIQTALVTGILIVALFLQVISEPEIRLMVSLFILALGMASLVAVIMTSRRYKRSAISDDAPYIAPQTTNDVSQQPRTRLDTIRNRISRRINRNDVPTNQSN